MVDQEAPGSLRLHPQAPPSEAIDADTLLRGRDSKGQLLDWGAPAPKLELIYIAQATQQPISTPAKVCAKSAKRVRCWMSLLQPHGPPTGSTGPARPTPSKATGASIIQLLTPACSRLQLPTTRSPGSLPVLRGVLPQELSLHRRWLPHHWACLLHLSWAAVARRCTHSRGEGLILCSTNSSSSLSRLRRMSTTAVQTTALYGCRLPWCEGRSLPTQNC